MLRGVLHNTNFHYRLELQEVKDDIGKALDDMKSGQQQFISNISEGIQEGKKKHVELSTEVKIVFTGYFYSMTQFECLAILYK